MVSCQLATDWTLRFYDTNNKRRPTDVSFFILTVSNHFSQKIAPLQNNFTLDISVCTIYIELLSAKLRKKIDIVSGLLLSA